MQGSLGEKIGEGKFSDVHAWAPGQVLKLWKAGVPQRTVSHEARMIRAVFAAGVPAPEVFGEVTLEGRFGIVLTRLDGPTLAHLSRTGAMTLQQVGAILATLAIDLHGTPPPAAVISLRDWMDHSMRGAGDRIPRHIADGILTLIDRLPPSGGLCHCDLHPGNVIMTADGPKLVDWIGAVRAHGALDLAVSHFLLSEIAPEHADDPERPRAINAALQSEYARLASMSPAALTAAMEPCLPIVCGFVLLGGVWPARRERLIQRVEAALRSIED
jgi:Ser/Thr protein kinase RdoA (MazF antagonist)